MPKKKSLKKRNEAVHTVLLKKHFPTFYNRPLIAVIILIVLILTVWSLQH